MYKIAAFIKFNKTIEKEVLLQKKKVEVNFGKQIYLDHPVHLTLFTLNINKISDLRKIYNKKKVKNKSETLNLEINSTGIFFNDPLTKGHTLHYAIKKNNLLKSIQMSHLKIINKKIYVFKNDIQKIKNLTLKKNYNKYGFPFAGRVWIPHITVASIKKIEHDHSFIRRFLKLKINYKLLIKNIEFYRVSNNRHYFLFKSGII